MKAFELYVLDLFLNIQKFYPASYHDQVLTQIREVYAPIQWSLLSPEAQEHYFYLESRDISFLPIAFSLVFFFLITEKTNDAANKNMVVIPVHSYHANLEMVGYIIQFYFSPKNDFSFTVGNGS